MLRVFHRHSVFTMPEGLRNFFYSRRELLKELQDGVYNVISHWHKKYSKAFCVNAKRRLDDTRQAVKYIGRYLARAAIAEYRIEEYDGDNITFWYEDHDDGHKIRVTMNVLEFIGKITQHIVPKGFKTVRRYGIYSRRRNKISKEIVYLYNFIKQMSIDKLLRDKKQEAEKKKTWKERIIDNFGRNPIQCKRCGIEKILWKIWHKDYGIIYDIRETRNVEDYYMNPLVERRYTEKLYKYHCLKYKYWEWAPADIVDEFADMDIYCNEEYDEKQNSKRKGMPVMVCPNCNADFYYSGEKKEKEHSYLAEDDECIPF